MSVKGVDRQPCVGWLTSVCSIVNFRPQFARERQWRSSAVLKLTEISVDVLLRFSLFGLVEDLVGVAELRQTTGPRAAGRVAVAFQTGLI